MAKVILCGKSSVKSSEKGKVLIHFDGKCRVKIMQY